MRILIIAPYVVEFGLAHFYARAFTQLGHQVRVFAIQEKPSLLASGARRAALWLAFRSRSAQRLVFATRRAELMRVTRDWEPDVVVVLNGYLLPGDVVSALRDESPGRVCQIYSDNPWADTNQVSHIWDTLRLFDCVFTFARYLVPGLYQRGARRVEYLPFGYDPEIHQARPTNGDERTLFASPVAYLGAWGPDIERCLEPVAPFGLKVWGGYWERVRPGSPLKESWQAPGSQMRGFGAEMGKVCAASSIVVNFVRSEHGCAHSMKTFELPACGAFVLSTRTEEQLEYFPEDRCAAYFWTQEEMLDKLRFYLSHSEARERIRLAGAERARPHTYAERAKTILSVCASALTT